MSRPASSSDRWSARAERLRALGLAAAYAAALWLLAAEPALAHATQLERSYPSLWGYFRLGVEHILGGVDHLLFLTGVVLIGGRLRDLLWAVTAFTLAHSLTLALQIAGIVSVDPAWVEVVIALSIAYVGVENFVLRDGARRFRLTFAFGLIHGLGFASALREIGVPPAGAALPLFCFNAGVETGQLAVLALIVPLLVWLRRKPSLNALCLPAFNAALIAVGLIWGAGRMFAAEPAAAMRPANAPTTQPAAGAPAAAGDASAGLPRSVYPHASKSQPWVQPLCEAIHELPRARRAACAGRKPGLTLVSECKRMLNAAIGSGALHLDGASAERCIAATQARYQGCAWTASPSLPALPECSAIVRGLRAEGASCRSSLECGAGQHCRGAGPLDAGVCAAREPAGARCGLAIDALGAYVPHAQADHRECQGECVQGRCQAQRAQIDD